MSSSSFASDGSSDHFQESSHSSASSGGEESDDYFAVTSSAAAAGKKKAAPAKIAKPATVTTKKKAVTKQKQSPVSVLSNSPPPSSSAAVRKAAAKPKGKKTIEEVYQKKSQLEHILLRPDSYIGSVEHIKNHMWVWSAEQSEMVYKSISYVPGFYKIFDEILVNAADNKIRDPGMDTLKVVIDKENGLISVYNNGQGIPIEIHREEKVYVPELIFGHLLTSSNYDDDEKKVTGGRNGYGAKLCNIFSKEFIVETGDSSRGKKFKQVFKDNMSVKGAPSILANARKEEFTRITFKPDFEKFGMASIDEETESLLQKRVYDLAGCLNGVKVYLNGERIAIKSFRQYVDLYVGKKLDPQTGKPYHVVHEINNERWEVAIAVSDGQFQQVSFVNSICTSKGGTHVNHVADQISSKLVESISKKNKAAPVKQFEIRNHMWIFVNCLIENPAFDSQTKENMTLKQSSFGSKCLIQDEFITKVKKTGIVEHVLHWAQFKQGQLLKKTDGSKKTRISGIAKLDDANNAGTRHAQSCTLILTEGDSAKTLAVTGLGVVGRDNYGVFPLRGKLLNVREASHTQIMDNQEINHIKQIMGLQHKKKYTDTSSLRYGHLMIMTDQDHDGSHIKGLIINFLDFFWPELLKVPGFLCEFITPIVKVTKGKNSQTFFTIPEYETWKSENNDGKGWTMKYYKGLGTSTKEDARRYFMDIKMHKKVFHECDDSERELIDMAFSKKKADNRKEWLRNFEPGTYIDHSAEEITMNDFIQKELILFSMADNVRSLPSFVDGLKPGLRKIMFACFKRNLVKDDIKVAQLSGYIAEHSAYHHGEQSLQSSIVGLAQNFTGSNNINLLEPVGQFGSRLQGGRDAASPRYIFTKLAALSRTIFNVNDDPLLNYLNDDGQSIEPDWYIPILPMVLVNGGEGIGTGWSSSIPNYNPADIVSNLLLIMDGLPPKPMDPWYLGFTGSISQQGADKYLVQGIIEKTGPTTVEITELPIKTWTQSYKEYLETLLHGSDKVQAFIKDYKEYHSDTKVHFVITLTEENMRSAEETGLLKKFKLSTTLSLSNMVCFDEAGRIRKFNSTDEILREFYQLRLKYYQLRKENLIAKISSDLDILDNKVRFIEEVVSGDFIVQNRKKTDIIQSFVDGNYVSFSDDGSSSAGYNYLLNLPILSLSQERINILREERSAKRIELNDLLSKTSKDLWRADLSMFMCQWEDVVASVESGQDSCVIPKVSVKKSAQRKKKQLAQGSESDDSDFVSFVKKPASVKPKKISKPVLSSSLENDITILESTMSSQSQIPARKRKDGMTSSPSPKKMKGRAGKFVTEAPDPIVILSSGDDGNSAEIRPAAVRSKKKLIRYVELSEGSESDIEDDDTSAFTATDEESD